MSMGTMAVTEFVAIALPLPAVAVAVDATVTGWEDGGSDIVAASCGTIQLG